jgi:hypothetical protein
MRDAPRTLWADLDDKRSLTRDADQSYLVERAIHFDVRKGNAALSADRRHRLEAIDRWFYSTWSPLDRKVKASIVEGIVVLLSLFDENPVVYRAFCPPRDAYVKPPKPGEARPLPPLEEVLESGHVLGLNFPVAMNRDVTHLACFEARLPARDSATHSKDRRESTRPWRICCSWRTSARIAISAKPNRQGTSGPSPSARRD